MAEDSEWFRNEVELRELGFERTGAGWTRNAERYVPLYEAKMVHQFDHRWATCNGAVRRDMTDAEKRDPTLEPEPLSWVPLGEVTDRLSATRWDRKWLIGWRDITNATNERTVIADVIPAVGSGHQFPLMFPDVDPRLSAALLSNMNSLVCDFVARQKLGGTHLTLYFMAQLPIAPPTSYSDIDLNFIVPRVLELTYTSHAIVSFARDLGHEGPPFSWDEGRRAHLRAELDAFHARAYGLTRDELRYILEPEDAMGAGYPSETFRGLKTNEIARFGEYRTQRLVLQAWDALLPGPSTDRYAVADHRR